MKIISGKQPSVISEKVHIAAESAIPIPGSARVKGDVDCDSDSEDDEDDDVEAKKKVPVTSRAPFTETSSTVANSNLTSGRTSMISMRNSSVTFEEKPEKSVIIENGETLPVVLQLQAVVPPAVKDLV